MSSPPLSPHIANDAAKYRHWRAQKLDGAERYLNHAPVDINNPQRLTKTELAEIGARIKAVNFAVYRTVSGDGALLALCRQVGLKKIIANPFSNKDGGVTNGVTEIRVADDARRREYVPYSNRALNWHTDGYYNPPQSRINSFAMHTVRTAARGGENQLLDYEMLYLMLRDRDPSLAECLFADDVMTIPPAQANASPRPARTAPVFEFVGGRLRMNFTLRARNIRWRPSRAVRDALGAIREMLTDDNPHIHTRRFAAGEGVLSNNVLHNRSAFTDGGDRDGDGERDGDDDGRLVLRARFADFIA